MKVIDLGHGGLAIEPESPADSVRTLTRTQLQQSNVSDEAINIYSRYIERTSSVTSRLTGTRTLPAKIFSIE